MSLEFTGGDSDRITCGRNSNVDNLAAATVCIWFWQDTDHTGNRQLFTKDYTTGVHIFAGWEYLDDSNRRFWVDRSRATTSLLALADRNNFTAWATGKWLFGVFQHDSAGSDTDQKIFIGDLSSVPAEPSAYADQQVGVGTPTSDASGNIIIGNRSAVDISWDGKIASVVLFNRLLSSGEILSEWRRPGSVTSGRVGFWHLGLTGTGTQVDLSGQGLNGTITGATIWPHAPITTGYGFDAWLPYELAAPAGNPLIARPKIIHLPRPSGLFDI